MGLRRWLRNWLSASGGVQTYVEEAPRQLSQLESMMVGSEIAIIAYRINNGYLMKVFDPNAHMRMGNSMIKSLVYCHNEKDLAEAILTESAKTRMGIDPAVKITSLGGGGGGNVYASKP